MSELAVDVERLIDSLILGSYLLFLWLVVLAVLVSVTSKR